MKILVHLFKGKVVKKSDVKKAMALASFINESARKKPPRRIVISSFYSLEDARMVSTKFPMGFLSKVDGFLNFYNQSENVKLSRRQFFIEAVEDFIKDKYPSEYKRFKFRKK